MKSNAKVHDNHNMKTLLYLLPTHPDRQKMGLGPGENVERKSHYFRSLPCEKIYETKSFSIILNKSEGKEAEEEDKKVELKENEEEEH
jgi:hypothetical protein